MIYNCLKCGIEFERKYGVRKYCSISCSQRQLQGSCADCQKRIRALHVRCIECRKKNSGGAPERKKLLARKKAYQISREPRGRHVLLKKVLKREGVPLSDIIWNLNFYTALIEGATCHYCLTPLNPTGHALDRKDSNRGHEASNVVTCCWTCNTIKGKYWEYEHMMLLAPKLRQLKNSPGAPDGRVPLS